MKKFLAVLAVFSFCTCLYPETHVFWFKATTLGYNLQDNAGGKGPALPAGAIVHEGNMATGAVAQHNGSNGPDFVCGSGLDDIQGRCGWFWSKDLCHLTGSVSSAKFRAEHRDGWAGNAFCNSGPIAIHRGVVDFQSNIDFWGGEDLVDAAANWKDDANLIGSFMAFNIMDPDIKAGDTLNITAPAGRPSEIDQSILDGQFLEVDCTPQVNWILAHTKEAGEAVLSGQYAIVFLVTPGQGSTGKINGYTNENLVRSVMGSDAPWTQDGNTAHLVMDGTVSVEKKTTQPVLAGISLSQNSPNPFRPATAINYNTGLSNSGTLKIYNAAGAAVMSKSVSGQGTVSWNAASSPSGLYLYRLTAGSLSVEKKMVLMK